MKPEWKERWLEALRSGKYKQTIGALRRPDSSPKPGMCCLGVLCDIVAPDAWEPGATPDIAMSHMGDEALPGKLVLETVGLPMFRSSTSPNVYDLPLMNDGGESFDTIADWIEENL